MGAEIASAVVAGGASVAVAGTVNGAKAEDTSTVRVLIAIEVRANDGGEARRLIGSENEVSANHMVKKSGRDRTVAVVACAKIAEAAVKKTVRENDPESAQTRTRKRKKEERRRRKTNPNRNRSRSRSRRKKKK